MRTFKLKTLFFVLLCTFMSANIFSQIKPSGLVEAWNNMAAMVIQTVKVMPSDHFTFKPTDKLVDFAGLAAHTASANYLFAPTVKLTTPKDIPVSASKDKETIIKELKASFTFIEEGIKKLTSEDLNEEISFFGKKVPRLQAILMMTSHLQREQGKRITYTRLKGLAPARSAGW